MTDDATTRERLRVRRRELQSQLRSSQSEERREVREDLEDNAKLWEASEDRDALDEDLGGELKQVDEALARLERGTYGSCASCGKPIGESRLEALPYATLCIRCAEAAG